MSLATVIVVAATTVSSAQTSVNISVDTAGGVEPPPPCSFPCQTVFKLPGFARTLALAGPDGTHKTPLTRPAFRAQLENWRSHMEVFRRTLELNLRQSSDWKKAHVQYLVEIGRYRQFAEAYRAGVAMERAGAITYGAGSLPQE